MKTTLEIPDSIYRQIKSSAALKGQTVRAFFLDAIQEKLNGQRQKERKTVGWRRVFGKARASDIKTIQKIIDEEFSRIDPEDWQ